MVSSEKTYDRGRRGCQNRDIQLIYSSYVIDSDLNIPYIKSGTDPTPLKKASTTGPYLVSYRDLAGEWQVTEAGSVRILSWDIPNRAGGEDSPLVECYNAMITAGDLVQDCLEKGRRKEERLQP